MADEEVSGSGYGYESDGRKVSPFVFGLNAGVTYLKEFKWIPNGGKDGAEQEALEIIFTINGEDKGHRQFPVTEAFIKNSPTKEKTTDPNHVDFKKAKAALSGLITHIAKAFMDEATFKSGISRGFASFHEYCDVVAALLPTDFNTRPLDIFLQYQYNIGKNQNKTYLEIPKNMKNGYWLWPAQAGNWTEKRLDKFTDDTPDALFYYDADVAITKNAKGEDQYKLHPISKSGYFLNSNNAVQQVDRRARQTEADPPSSVTGTGIPPATGTKPVW